MNAEMSQAQIDAQLEREIFEACHIAISHPDEKVAQGAFFTMRELIACRSPAQVRQMELRMGLLKVKT